MPEIVQIALAVGAAGAISGMLAGLFGIGGGAVMVPVLYQALAALGVDETVRMHVAVGSSSAIIIPTSIRSFLSHLDRGTVDTALLRTWVFAVPVGGLLAGAVAAFVSSGFLRAVFAVLALLFGLRLIFLRIRRPLAPDLPGEPLRTLIGGGIGLLSGLMGIGGGIINNTFMALFGRPMRECVATSSGVGVLVSIPATLGFIVAGWGHPDLPAYAFGFVSLPVVALVVPVSVLSAPLGVRLAHHLPPRALEIAFGLFLLTVAARFAWGLLT